MVTTTGRATRIVFVAAAVGMIAFYASVTAAPLVATDLVGARWGGLPGAVGILGTALGAALWSSLMARRGRRPGLVVGWSVGGLGCGLAVLAIGLGSFLLFLVALLAIGGGHASNQLARYAAADAYTPARRGRIVSLVVWAGTIGAVVGPSLIGPTAGVAEAGGFDGLTGGYAAGVVAFALAGLLVGLWFRVSSATDPAVEEVADPRVAADPDWDRPMIVAVTALVVAQFVMVMIMTMTPVELRSHEHGLGAVGFVISAHVFGMFGLSPVFGWAGDRFGALRVTFAGLVGVAASGVLAAVAPASSLPLLTVALVLLGLGWSATFVASSSLLSRAGARLQGRADALAWAVAGVASLGSGVILDWGGYAVLATMGAVLAVSAAVLVARVAARRPVLADL